MSFQPPDHWLSHSGPGPSGWFTVDYPPSWNTQETEGIFSLSPPEEVGLLTIKATWGAHPGAVKLEDLLNLKRLFPRRRRVRQLPPLAIDAESLVYEGEVRPPTAGSWWKRWFTRASWRRWRIWVIRRGRVCLFALYLHSKESDPEVLTLVSMILQTLRIAESPADPPERFTERVLELARREFPSLPCEAAPDFQLKVGESRINLFNFYRSYIASPDQFEAIVLPALSTVVQVQGWGKERLEPDWDQVRDRIMPMLYPVDAWKERFSNFIGSDWVAGLVILYVVDESHAYWYIRKELLDRWGLSTDELHDKALQNLDRYFHDSPMELTGAGDPEGPQILLPTKPDAYNSSRFLSSEFRGKLQDVLGREFAVGMPNRDFFVAVSTQTPEAVEHVRQKVAEDYLQMDHPLTSTMLFVTSDGTASKFS